MSDVDIRACLRGDDGWSNVRFPILLVCSVILCPSCYKCVAGVHSQPVWGRTTDRNQGYSKWQQVAGDRIWRQSRGCIEMKGLWL